MRFIIADASWYVGITLIMTAVLFYPLDKVVLHGETALKKHVSLAAGVAVITFILAVTLTTFQAY
jgi:hypothetical protein